MKILVGVPVHNLFSYTKLAFDSFLKEWMKKNPRPNELFCDFVVVDNASTDQTGDYFRNYPSVLDNMNLHYIKFQENYGVSKSYNAIFKVFDEVEADLCVLINNDIVFSENWLDNLLGFIEEHPEAGIISPHVIDNHINQEAIKHWFGNHPRDGTPTLYGPGIEDWYKYAQNVIDAEKDQIDVGCHGCLTAFTRSCRDSVGDYDENFIKGYYDDLDYSYRTLAKGYTILTTHRAVIFHWGGATGNYVTEHGGGNAYREQNKQYFMRKWRIDIDSLGAICSRSLLWTHPQDNVNELVLP